MGFNFATPLGSVCDVSPGDKFYRTEAECQAVIDNMKGWIGMGDRKRYRPLKLISSEVKP